MLDRPVSLWYNFLCNQELNIVQALQGRVTVSVALREWATGGKLIVYRL
jgi:hypothetical protein